MLLVKVACNGELESKVAEVIGCRRQVSIISIIIQWCCCIIKWSCRIRYNQVHKRLNAWSDFTTGSRRYRGYKCSWDCCCFISYGTYKFYEWLSSPSKKNSGAGQNDNIRSEVSAVNDKIEASQTQPKIEAALAAGEVRSKRRRQPAKLMRNWR